VLLQHEDGSGAGLLLDALANRNLRSTTIRVDRGERLPDPRGATFAVSLGGTATATATATTPWIQSEIDWIRAAHGVGTPVLGLSFGAQTLALALGGSVERAASPERGLIQIATLAPEQVPTGPWPAWHDDAIVLPPDAELLAYNDSGPQAFRVGPHLGVQFHPEVTPEIAGGWVLHQHTGEIDSQAVLEGIARERYNAIEAARTLFDAFIDGALRNNDHTTNPRAPVPA
jgi:GMP synthase (glutamine-hydrolysing)